MKWKFQDWRGEKIDEWKVEKNGNFLYASNQDISISEEFLPFSDEGEGRKNAASHIVDIPHEESSPLTPDIHPVFQYFPPLCLFRPVESGIPRLSYVRLLKYRFENSAGEWWIQKWKKQIE